MKRLLFTVVAGVLFIVGCSKDDTTSNDDNNKANQTLASTVAGSYTGTGKYMPANISFGGNTATCAIPAGWEAYLNTGSASANVVAINDSTVKITITSGAFSPMTYDNIKLTKSGNTILMNNSGSNYFDTNSKSVILKFYSTANFSLNPGFSCNPTHPYVTVDYLSVPGGKNFSYKTKGSTEFSGSK